MGIEAKMTTLCYIEKDGAYLMLHRVSKKHDVCKDKWRARRNACCGR